MRDPVLSADGHTYEKHAMEDWLRTHDTSPMTNEVLSTKELRPNLILKQMIQSLNEHQWWLASDCFWLWSTNQSFLIVHIATALMIGASYECLWVMLKTSGAPIDRNELNSGIQTSSNQLHVYWTWKHLMLSERCNIYLGIYLQPYFFGWSTV